MKKRDWAVVAVILAAALLAGLVLVRHALDRAAQTQLDSLAAAQFNGGETAPPETTAPAHTGGETSPAPTETTAPQESAPLSETPAPVAESGQPLPTETPSEEAVSDGTPPPSAGGGTKTLAELIDWMRDESSGALAAQSLGQAELALASGVGTSDDALRRAFAQSQAPRNEEARQNQLAEEVAAPAFAYLRRRDTAALREESVAFYRALEAEVSAQVSSAQASGDTARLERAQADLETVQTALAQAEEALQEAEAELDTALQELNTVLGNPYGTDLALSDVLEAEPMPTLTADEAVSQALENRNEVHAAAYQVEREQQALSQLRYTYAPDSPEVLTQQAALTEAEAACPQAELQVETEVRDLLSSLETQNQELTRLSESLSQLGGAPEAVYTLETSPAPETESVQAEETEAVQAEETEAAAAWSSDFPDLMARRAEWEDLRAGQIEKLAQFNLDVLRFQHAIGAGCTAAAI